MNQIIYESRQAGNQVNCSEIQKKEKTCFLLPTYFLNDILQISNFICFETAQYSMNCEIWFIIQKIPKGELEKAHASFYGIKSFYHLKILVGTYCFVNMVIEDLLQSATINIKRKCFQVRKFLKTEYYLHPISMISQYHFEHVF